MRKMRFILLTLFMALIIGGISSLIGASEVGAAEDPGSCSTYGDACGDGIFSDDCMNDEKECNYRCEDSVPDCDDSCDRNSCEPNDDDGGSGSADPEPIDCQVSGWSGWSSCSASCGGGTQTRTRSITTHPENGGASCPSLSETRSCNTHACTQPLTVYKSGNGTGTIRSDNVDGIYCGGDCSHSFVEGSRVILRRYNGTGLFRGWSGACAGFGTNATCSLTMNSAYSVTAVFERPYLEVYESPGVGGFVTGEGYYNLGATANPSVSTNPGYRFNYWSGACSGSGLSCGILMNNDKSVQANYYTVPPEVDLYLHDNPVGYNASTDLEWVSNDATNCTGTNFSTGGAVNGEVSTGNLTSPTTYSIRCTGPDPEDATDSLTAKVYAPRPEILTFTAEPVWVRPGNPVTLSWDVDPGGYGSTTECRLTEGGRTIDSSTAMSGSYSELVNGAVTYTLTCTSSMSGLETVSDSEDVSVFVLPVYQEF